MRAYVLIDANKKIARKIASELRKRPDVLIADTVNGPYAVITCIEAENPALLAQAILFGIRNIEGVKDLTVYLSINGDNERKINENLVTIGLPGISGSLISDTANHQQKKNRKPNEQQ